jgi:Ca2+-binding RTX toxin-like protein
MLSATWVDAETEEVIPAATVDADIFYGDAEANTANGLAGDDVLNGGLGDDVLAGGLGNDVLDGGGGFDMADYGAAPGAVTVDLSAGTAIGADGTDTLTSIEGVTGSDYNDAFAFSAASDGESFTVDGGGGSDTLDLSSYDLEDVTFGDGDITVDLGAGESFTVNHSNIETVQLADETATVLSGDASESGFSGSGVYVDGDEAFRVELDGDGSVDWSYDADADTLSITDNDNTDQNSGLTITDLNGTDLTVDSITLDTGIGSVNSSVDLDAVNIAYNASVPNITVAGGSGTIDALSYTGGGDVTGGAITIDADVNTLSVEEFDTNFTIDGDLGTGSIADDITAGTTLAVTGDVGSLTVADAIELTSNVNIGGNVGTLQSGAMAGSVSVTGNLDAMTVVGAASDLDGTLTVGGNLGTLDVGDDIDGAVDVTGNVTTINVGDGINAAIAIDGDAGSITAGGLFNNLTVGGDLTSLEVMDATGNVSVTGDLTSMAIVAGSGGDMDGNLTVGGNLGSLTAADDLEGSITVTGNAGTISATDEIKTSADIIVGGDVGTISGNTMTTDATIGGDLDTFDITTNFTGSLTASEIEGQFDLTDGASTYSRNAAQAAELTYEGATDTFPNNVAPDAVNDSIAVEIDTPFTTGSVFANDTDSNGDTLTIQSFTQAAHGTVANNGDGTFTYTPDSAYEGADSFTYTIEDGAGGTDTATVNVVVEDTPDTLNGTDGDDTITGDEYYDIVNAGDGDDTITGGLGDDTLNGGLGNDTFVDSGGSSLAVEMDALNPVSYWQLGEDSGASAVDSAGGHNGVYTNGVTLGQSGLSADDTAVHFDGSNDFIEIAHSDDFLLDNGTLQLSFNADDVSGSQGLFSKDSSGYDTGGHFSVYLDGSTLSVRLQSASGDYNLSSSGIQAGQWYNVAVSFGDDGMKLFVNGSEADTDPYTGGLGTTSGGTGNYEPITIGAATWGSDNLTTSGWDSPFAGSIDEVALFGSQLSGAQVQSLHTVAAGGGVADGDTMDGGGGTDTVDYSNVDSSVTVDLAAGTATGGSGTDTLSNIENVTGSDYNDTLTGDTNANVLDGGAGNDTLVGGGGDDTLTGAAGNDTFQFTNAQDGDVITVDGGAGTDVVDLSAHNSENITVSDDGGAITVDMGGGESFTVNTSNTEQIMTADGALTPGTSGDDALTGGDGDEAVSGYDGDDSLNGGLGDDVLDGGLGDDTFVDSGVAAADSPIDALNPVGHWRLGDSSGTVAVDAAGDNDGIYANGVTLGQDGLTADNTAVHFDGTNDFVEIPHSDDFLLDNGTLQLSFNADDVSDTQGLFSKDSSGTDTGGHFSVYLSGSTLTVRLQSTSGDYYLSSSGIQADQWYDVAVSFGSDGMKLFVDGSEVDTDGYTGGLGTTSGGIGNYEPIAIGALTGGTDDMTNVGWSDAFAGSIDEVALFDSQLSPEQVQSMHNGAGGAAASNNDTMDGGAGSDTVDYSDVNSAVTVDLAAGTATGGSGTDTLSNIENVTGSDSNDSLTGDANSNALDGGAGNDTLTGGGGDDTLTGGTGLDTLTGGEGDDVLTPGGEVYTPTLAHAEQVDDLSPLGHWRLSESSGTTAVDEVGGHDAVYQNGVTQDVDGIVEGNSAARFDGVNDFVEIPHSDDMLLDNGTVQLWFNADDVSDYQGLFSKDSSGYDTGGHFTVAINNSQVTVRLQSDDASYSIASSDISADEWHHVAVSFGDDGLRLYVDGSLAASSGYTGGLGTTSGGTGNYDPIAIGADTGGSGNLTTSGYSSLFTGEIDEVAMFGTALTADEVSSLYTSGAGGDQGPVGDTVDGGAGVDTVSYSDASSGVTVDLAAGTATDGAGSDTLTNIENAVGSDHDDTLVGDANNNVLTGGLGDDTLTGGGGIDTADYSDAASSVTVDLTVGTATGGAGTDTLTSIENVVGSDHDDTFAFSAPTDGEVFAVDGHAGTNTIDLSGFSSADATLDTVEGTVSVNMGGGESFSIEYSNIETLQFSDTALPANNVAPDAANDLLVGNEDTSVTTGNVLTNDTDLNGDTLSVQSFTQAANGTVVDNGNGTFTYTPDANYNGADSFTYTITDGNGGTDTATVDITVNPVDEPIEAVAVRTTNGRSVRPDAVEVTAAMPPAEIVPVASVDQTDANGVANTLQTDPETDQVPQAQAEQTGPVDQENYEDLAVLDPTTDMKDVIYLANSHAEVEVIDQPRGPEGPAVYGVIPNSGSNEPKTLPSLSLPAAVEEGASFEEVFEAKATEQTDELPAFELDTTIERDDGAVFKASRVFETHGNSFAAGLWSLWRGAAGLHANTGNKMSESTRNSDLE